MNYQEYLNKRKQLMGEAQAFIDEGKFDEAEKKMAAVSDLDAQWDGQAKATANMRALEGEQRKANMQDLGGMQVPGAKQVDSMGKEGLGKEDAYKTEEYKNAWAKVMTGRHLTDAEDQVFHMVNEAYTHTTENTPVVIPETVVSGIWKEIGEKYPYWADIKKTYIKGQVTMIRKKSSTGAKWYVEPVKTEDGKEVLEKTQLNGCELSRAITVSWKLKEMAISEFIPYIISEMAEEMGKGLAYGATHGKGPSKTEAPEPLGVVTALEADENKAQVLEYTKGKLSYKDLTSARAKIKSGYHAAIYANSDTIWNELANVLDANKRPIFVADAINGGVYKVLGCTVKEDGSMQDGELLFSDAGRGYHANINKQVSVSTEEHIKERTTDYCGYAIADGAPVTMKAHALLKVASTEAASAGE